MKRILFVALSATLLAAGCQKTEIINPVGNQINFSTDMGKLTKVAGVTPSADAGVSLVNVQKQGMSIVAYKAYDGESDLYGKMSANYSSSSWTPGATYYWPGTEKDLDFYAVSGYDIYDTENVYVTNGGVLTMANFTLNQADPVDLMVANKVTQNQSDLTVDFTFNHALSLVEFYFANANTAEGLDITVKSVKLSSVVNKASFTGTVTDGFSEGHDWEWTPAADAAAAYTTTATALTLAPNKDLTLFSTNLFIPQTIFDTDKSIKLQAEVSYSMNNLNLTQTIDLGSSEHATWAVNQHVKYNVKFAAAGEISFTAQVVNGWASTVTPDVEDLE